MLLDSATSQATLIPDLSGTVNQEEKASLNTLPTHTDESSVCRSKRIAIVNAGYKNVAAKEKAKNKEPKIIKKNKKGKNKSSDYSAMVIDDTAPPPLELPLDSIQTIATKRCQVPLVR
jgi:hypothetical protein